MPFQKRDLFRLQDPGPDFEITCAGKGYAWCHWILPGYKTNCPTEIRRVIFRLRRRVNVFSQFGGQLSAEKCFRKASGDYVCIRLENQVPEYNLCMAFSDIFWSSCDIGKIKQLIFWKFVLPKSGRDFTAFYQTMQFLTISSAFLNSLYQHPIFLTNTSHHIRYSKHHIRIFF